MPAAAVIPAPVAYIKVVAVKKLVVGFLADRVRSEGVPRQIGEIGTLCRRRAVCAQCPGALGVPGV